MAGHIGHGDRLVGLVRPTMAKHVDQVEFVIVRQMGCDRDEGLKMAADTVQEDDRFARAECHHAGRNPAHVDLFDLVGMSEQLGPVSHASGPWRVRVAKRLSVGSIVSGQTDGTGGRSAAGRGSPDQPICSMPQ